MPLGQVLLSGAWVRRLHAVYIAFAAIGVGRQPLGKRNVRALPQGSMRRLCAGACAGILAPTHMDAAPIPCPALLCRSIEVDGKAAQVARAGDSADVALSGIDTTAVGAGSVLCHPGFPVPLVTKFEARVVVLEVPVPILRGQAVTLHAYTARGSGHVTALVSLLDSKTGEVVRRRPRCLLKGQSAVVEITPARPLCLEEYADYRALGRVALRDAGRTLAVGIVTKVVTAADEQQQQQQGQG